MRIFAFVDNARICAKRKTEFEVVCGAYNGAHTYVFQLKGSQCCSCIGCIARVECAMDAMNSFQGFPMLFAYVLHMSDMRGSREVPEPAAQQHNH